MKNKKITTYVFVFLIVALGFLVRFYNIDNLPPGIYPDEAANGEDAIRANDTGAYQWFYPNNTGREGLFMNLIAFSFKIFGASITALKLPAILFGTLTVFGVYLLTKEILEKRRIALVASFLYAFSYWAINFSRIAFRANMLPCILVFSSYFLFRGLRTKKWLDFAVGGFIFGIGMHSYIAWRISPLILVLMLFFFFMSRKDFFKEHWKHILTFLFASIVAAAPMFWTFYQHPQYLEARDSVSILSPQINQGHPFMLLLRTMFLSLQKYNFIGDMNWRHNFPPYPLLDQITGLLFVLGLIISFRRLWRAWCAYRKHKTHDIDIERYAFLILWFFIMLAPEFMAGEGNPHALRSIGTLPVVIILSAIGFEYFFEKAKKRYHENNKVLAASIAILLFIGIFNTLKYHVFWASNDMVGYSFNKNVTDMYRYIETLPKDQEKYVITSYNTLIKLPIYIFTSKDRTIHYYFPNELDKIKTENPDNTIFLFIENNPDAIGYINNKYPQMSLEEKDYPLGSKFYVLKK